TQSKSRRRVSDHAKLSKGNRGGSSCARFRIRARGPGHGPGCADGSTANVLHGARIQRVYELPEREGSAGTDQIARRVRLAVSEFHAASIHLFDVLPNVLPAEKLFEGA